MTTGDLGGYTVLDLGGMGPAARCVRMLADLGARWIRLVAPSGADRVRPNSHDYGALRGAEQMEINLKARGARAVFLRLAEQADVIVEGYRPGVADRLGIGYDDVRAVNPRIIYCAATGYGQDGPYAQRAGHDLNYQALTGAIDLAGWGANGVPAMPGLTLADSAGGGWQAVIRIMAALLARQASGVGTYIDASAAEGVLHLMSRSIDDVLANGRNPRESFFSGQFACYNIYKTADGKCLAVAALEPKFFATLCAVLGLDRLVPSQYDLAAQPEAREAMAVAFAANPRDVWVDLLGDKDVCVSPVLSVAEVTADAHWVARGMFASYRRPGAGASRQLTAFGRDQAGDRGDVPSPDASDAILASFDFSPDEILALKSQAVVG